MEGIMEGQDQGLHQSDVDVTALSDEQLSELSDKLARGEMDDESTVKASEDKKADSEGAAQDAGGDEGVKEKEGGEEGAKEPTLEDLKAEFAKLQEENAKLTSARDAQSKYEQLRSSELGILRKQLDILRNTSPLTDEQLQELAVTDPGKAREALRREEEARQAEAQLTNQLATADVEGLVFSRHPDFKELMPDIAKAMDEDYPGAGANFHGNPFSLHPAVLHNLAMRVKADKEVKKLQLENEILRREKKASTEDTLKKIDAAAKSKTQVGARGAPTQKVEIPEYSQADIAKMSDTELAELEKRLAAR